MSQCSQAVSHPSFCLRRRTVLCSRSLSDEEVTLSDKVRDLRRQVRELEGTTEAQALSGLRQKNQDLEVENAQLTATLAGTNLRTRELMQDLEVALAARHHAEQRLAELEKRAVDGVRDNGSAEQPGYVGEMIKKIDVQPAEHR